MRAPSATAGLRPTGYRDEQPEGTRACKFDDWLRLPTSTVEIRRNGTFVRTARVDAATTDSRILWLAPDGVDARILIDKREGYEVWLEPQQLQSRQDP